MVFRRLCLILAIILCLSLYAFKTDDVPKTVGCNGTVPASTELGGLRFFNGLGEGVHVFAAPIPEGEVRRVVKGMWLVFHRWWDAFSAAANGRGKTAAQQQQEDRYAKAQDAHDNGCDPCPPTPTGNGNLAQAIAYSDSGRATGGYDAETISIATTAYRIAKERGLPDRAVIVALSAGWVESAGIHSKRYSRPGSGDRDSIGWLQQRPSSGWGTVAQLGDPAYAARKFYDALVKLNGWEGMPVGVAAQRVQISAYPDRYGAPEVQAKVKRLFAIVSQSQGGSPTPAPEPEQPAACQQPESGRDGQDPSQLVNYRAGSIRVVTDPTSRKTYRIPIPAGPAGKALNFALDQLGEPYVFGSQGPDTWDCSGLTSKAWKAAGYDVYPQTEVLARQEPRATGPSQPGDLLYRPGHVQMFVMKLPSGRDLIIEAPRTGLTVRLVAQWMTPTGKFRPTGEAA